MVPLVDGVLSLGLSVFVREDGADALACSLAHARRRVAGVRRPRERDPRVLRRHRHRVRSRGASSRRSGGRERRGRKRRGSRAAACRDRRSAAVADPSTYTSSAIDNAGLTTEVKQRPRCCGRIALDLHIARSRAHRRWSRTKLRRHFWLIWMFVTFGQGIFHAGRLAMLEAGTVHQSPTIEMDFRRSRACATRASGSSGSSDFGVDQRPADHRFGGGAPKMVQWGSSTCSARHDVST